MHPPYTHPPYPCTQEDEADKAFSFDEMDDETTERLQVRNAYEDNQRIIN